MKWSLSEMHGMNHMAHAHAMHMPHPAHWFREHPMALAILMVGLIALLMFGLMKLVNGGIAQPRIDPLNYPWAFPFYPAS
ncbi:MAG: hypothetical protein JEZ10_05705 [Verrucomicrobia bacterium]|nr:hypothetical protein [Verrucomicrobiota bacterium]